MWEKTYKYIKYFGLHHIFQGAVCVHKICRTQTYGTYHGYLDIPPTLQQYFTFFHYSDFYTILSV